MLIYILLHLSSAFNIVWLQNFKKCSHISYNQKEFSRKKFQANKLCIALSVYTQIKNCNFEYICDSSYNNLSVCRLTWLLHISANTNPHIFSSLFQIVFHFHLLFPAHPLVSIKETFSCPLHWIKEVAIYTKQSRVAFIDLCWPECSEVSLKF
jgi:hypothetical protein